MEEKEFGPKKLFINGIPINRISGPVLCYYLKPSDVMFDKMRRYGIDLPLLLLFGDIHGSSDMMCLDCDNYNGCYRIFDGDLIKLVGSLATPRFPVDFYVETSERHLDFMKDITIDQPLIRFMKEYDICFRRTTKGTIEYTKKCTDNIKWHYSDIRTREKYIEGTIYSLSNYILSLIKSDQKHNEYKDKMPRLDVLIKLLNSSETMMDFCNNFFDLLPTESLVVKQYNKTNKFKVDEIEYMWKDIFYNLVSQRLGLIDKEGDPINIDIKSNRFNLLEDLSDKSSENKLILIKILDAIYNSTLEIYTVLRMLKGENVQSSLVLSYLGLSHISKILFILKSLDYQLIFKAGDESVDTLIEIMSITINPYVDRCIEFIGGVQDSIDLKRDVENHNIKRRMLIKFPNISVPQIYPKV